jgi:hypothetical protein
LNVAGIDAAAAIGKAIRYTAVFSRSMQIASTSSSGRDHQRCEKT